MKPVLLILSFFFTTVSFGQTLPREEQITICTTEKEVVDGQLVLTDVDTPPVYSKGRAEFNRELGLVDFNPVLLKRKATIPHPIELKIYISYIVDTTGDMRDFCIMRTDTTEENVELEIEVIKALKSLDRWTPGEHEGKKVPVRMVFPIRFRLEK